MDRLYAVDGELYEAFDEAVGRAACPGDVLVVEPVGYLDGLAEHGEMPTDGEPA